MSTVKRGEAFDFASAMACGPRTYGHHKRGGAIMEHEVRDVRAQKRRRESARARARKRRRANI